jgi:hypothetical protein
METLAGFEIRSPPSVVPFPFMSVRVVALCLTGPEMAIVVFIGGYAVVSVGVLIGPSALFGIIRSLASPISAVSVMVIRHSPLISINKGTENNNEKNDQNAAFFHLILPLSGCLCLKLTGVKSPKSLGIE